MTIKTIVRWDQHILVVFSVLVGLVFQKGFDFIQAASFGSVEVILAGAVFYVVLDNWYFLHKDLSIFDVDKPAEVILYVISTIVYSCLPFLYGASAKGRALGLDPAQWFLANLIVICLIDALRKVTTVRKFHNPSNPLDNEQKKLVGRYLLFALTGCVYTVFLYLLLQWLQASRFDPINECLVIVPFWLLIRITDILVIPRVAGYAAHIYLDS